MSPSSEKKSREPRPPVVGPSVVQVDLEGPWAAASAAWRHAGKLRATLVAKACFSFADASPVGSPLLPLPAEPVTTSAARWPDGTIQSPSELALVLGQAEVHFVGKSAGRDAGLALLRHGQVLVHKAARGLPGLPGAGFEALPAVAPDRIVHLGGLEASRIQEAAASGALLDLPDAFDHRFFQAAARDQRFDGIVGGETLVLADLHPRLARVTIEIPHIEARAVADLAGAVVKVVLRCDTVIVDTDRERLTLLWRGRLAANRLDSLAATRVRLRLEVQSPGRAAAIERHGQDDRSGSFENTVAIADEGEPAILETLSIDDDAGPDPALAEADAGYVLPFQGKPTTAAPPSSGLSDFEKLLAGGTVSMSPEQVAAQVKAAAVPFRTPGEPAPPPRVPPARAPMPPPVIVMPRAVVEEPQDDEPPSERAIDDEPVRPPERVYAAEPEQPPRGGGAAPPSSSRGVDSVAEGQEGVGHGRIVASEGVGFDPAAPRGGGPMEPLPKPKPRTRPNIRATLKKK